ncbi:MAG: replicative DNA helicase [Crinalium sp.]
MPELNAPDEYRPDLLLSPVQSPSQLTNVEIEEAVLGGILLDPEAIDRVIDWLASEVFYIPAHRLIYRACAALHLEGQPKDLINVSAWLKDHELLEKSGGLNKLVQLVERTVSAVNIDALGQLLIDKYRRRRMVLISNEIMVLAYDTHRSWEEILADAEAKFELLKSYGTQGEHLVSLGDTIADTFTNIEQAHEDKGVKSALGVKTKFYDLDKYIGGLEKGSFVVIGGRPSMGKTGLGMNIAQNVAEQGCRVAIFSLEMSRDQLATRLLATVSKVEYNALRSGDFSESHWENIARSMAYLSELPIYIDERGGLSLTQIRMALRDLVSRVGSVDLVLIDYLQQMSEPSASFNVTAEMTKISKGMKPLAKEFNTSVIALSQLNRSVESRTDKHPTMSDLRESGSLEQDADIILMVYRDVYYHPGTPDPNTTEIIIAKNRNGPVGVVKLLFDATYATFKNLTAPRS